MITVGRQVAKQPRSGARASLFIASFTYIRAFTRVVVTRRKGRERERERVVRQRKGVQADK